MVAKREVSQRTVGRLAHYRRILLRARNSGREQLYSHEIAEIAGVTSAQVRRDLMVVGFAGHPVHGYDIDGLLAKLDRFLDRGRPIRMALAGVGNLGRALLAYFNEGIVAAFDADPERGHPIEELPRVLAKVQVDVGVIAVPANAAQEVADLFVAAGVRSLLNLAPVHLQVPGSVFVEDVDLGLAIEKAAFFARARS